MTLDCYADLFDEDLDAVADRLDVIHDAARGLPADLLRTEAQLISCEDRPKCPQASKYKGFRQWRRGDSNP